MLQEICQLNVFRQRVGVLAITKQGYLGVPVRDMLVTLPISFLTQRSNNISKSAQTLVDVLRLFQPIFVVPSPTLFEPFRTSEIDEVERTLAGITTRDVLS
jgi:hypothetical protein